MHLGDTVLPPGKDTLRKAATLLHRAAATTRPSSRYEATFPPSEA